MDRDEWALTVWGKHWPDCTGHEQAEALRLRDTPVGAGFEPRPDPALAVWEPSSNLEPPF